MGLLDEAVQTARLRVGADLLLFRKSLHTLEGVVADIGAGDESGRCGAPCARSSTTSRSNGRSAGWPCPDFRAFATRLSNGDLARWMLSLPWAATRFWLDQGLDLLRTP